MDRHPCAPRTIRIELKISHEELSDMVGTTRPRISIFMQRFHNLGLIETNRDRFLVVKKNLLLISLKSPRATAHLSETLDIFFTNCSILDRNISWVAIRLIRNRGRIRKHYLRQYVQICARLAWSDAVSEKAGHIMRKGEAHAANIPEKKGRRLQRTICCR
jgi:hypothetical protein